MSKLTDAKEILNALQVPAKQQNGMCCCVLLAMAGLTEDIPWSDATNNWIRIHDVIAFANSHYGMTYAENSRETFRITLETLHLLRITVKQQIAQIIAIV